MSFSFFRRIVRWSFAAFCVGVLIAQGRLPAWQLESTPNNPQLQPIPEAELARFEDDSDPELDDSTDIANEQELPADVRASSFENITPGKSTAGQLREALGEPVRTITSDLQTTRIYKVGPFPKVEVVTVDDVVTSVVIHLPKPGSPEQIAEQLRLAKFRAAPVPNDSGEVLGIVYPDRGVTLGYSADAEADQPQIAYLVLEPISAEPFLLRASFDGENRYQEDLADLNYAIKLDANNPQPHWLKAKILAAVGRFSEALESAGEAVRIDSHDAGYRLLMARMMAENGMHDEAIEETKKVLAASGAAVVDQARAENQLGDLIAGSPQPDYIKANKHHLAAIKLAAPLVSDHRLLVSQSAKHVLIDAHLGVAGDVAWGNWKNKQAVLEQWLDNAKSLVENIIDDGGGEPLQLLVQRKTLQAYVGMQGEMDPTAAASAAFDLGRRLIRGAKDPLYQQQLEWELAQALFDAARVERARRNAAQSLRYAENAVALIEQAGGRPDATPRRTYLLGRLYFLMGSVQALNLDDHDEATAWYDQAIPLMKAAATRSATNDLAAVGDRFVGMGVSFWQAGSEEKAIELSEYGAELIKSAVEGGKATADALAIAYGNLATMHRTSGDQTKAKKYAELAARLENLTGEQQH